MSVPVVFPQFGGQSTVSAISTQYPFTPGVDVLHDTPAGIGALAASDGLSVGELVKTGTFSVSAAATGAQSEAVTFTNAFPTACDAVVFGLTSLGSTAAVVNGGPVASSVSKTGFTATVNVTTAGAGSVTGYWIAFGH